MFASVDGYVSNLDIREGTQAVANQPLLALVDVNSFWVFGYFRENQLANIKIGDEAKVTLMAYPEQPIEAVVDSVGWGIAPQNGAVGYNLLPSVNPVFQWIRLGAAYTGENHLGTTTRWREFTFWYDGVDYGDGRAARRWR